MTQITQQNLKSLANFLGCGYEGDATCKVDCIAPLDKAGANSVSFVAQEKYLAGVAECKAGILVLKPEHSSAFKGNKLLVPDPYLAYARLTELFDPRTKTVVGVHPSAVIDATASIGDSVAIAANCVIGANAIVGAGTEVGPGSVIGANTVVGEGCLLHANVTLYEGVSLGNKVIVHSGSVIGSDGFGFAPGKDAGWVKIHQLGGVRIGNRVEIGSNTSIDRGALHDTVIEDGVIIDNLVHIAHGVSIGQRTAIAACVGIAGSTSIGKNCTIAGAVSITGHISIADGTHYHGGTVVTKGNQEPGAYASVTPMQDIRSWRRNSVRFTQLDDIATRLKKLEKLNQ